MSNVCSSRNKAAIRYAIEFREVVTFCYSALNAMSLVTPDVRMAMASHGAGGGADSASEDREGVEFCC